MGLTGKMVDRYSDSRFASPAAHIAFARIVDRSPAPGVLDEFPE
jgi:vanillate O-demethylase monooxygenase subunit